MADIPGWFPYGQPTERLALPWWLRMPLVLDGGISRQRNPLVLSEHSHSGYELHVIDSGTMPQWTRSGERLAARGGDVVLMQPGVLHGGDDNIIPKSSLLWLVFDPTRPKAMQHTPFNRRELTRIDQRLAACGNRVARADAAVRGAAGQIAELLPRVDDDETVVWALRAQIASLLAAAVPCLEQAGGQPAVSSEAVAAAVRLMAQQLEAPLSVEAIAAAVELSPSRFYELFKAEVGVTPADYYLRMRISAARQALIEQPAASVASIAGTFGFTNARHFATTFKRFTGITPTAARADQGR